MQSFLSIKNIFSVKYILAISQCTKHIKKKVKFTKIVVQSISFREATVWDI